MACYHPLRGFRALRPNPNTGKRSIVFTKQEGFQDLPVELPCGQCIGCKLERSKAWAIRCVHEASLYEDNCFITLTYADHNLPPDLSLRKDHFQKFMKRLRFENSGRNIRFFHCGEYGEKYGRPHYHACLFNFDFVDKTHWKTINGQKLYRSKALERLWPYGHSSVGSVTFESAAYVARYITKKITGPMAYEHYNVIDRKTGEVLAERVPEYTTMSRRPGIGKGWYDKFKNDVFPDDFVVVRGKKLKPPKFYRDQHEKEHARESAKLKAERKHAAKNNVDNTFPRLKAREEIQYEKLNRLKRSFENGQT